MSPFVLAALRLLMFTGARRDEIRTLQWSYIDAARGLAFLPDSKSGKKVLYLSQAALSLLETIPRLEGNPYAFPGGRGDQARSMRAPRPVADLQIPWEQIRAHAKLPELRIHDLRHSYASLLAASGTPLLVIGKLLGHKRVATTERYAHLSEDPLRLANERAGDQLARSLQIGSVHRQVEPNGWLMGK